MYGGRVVDMIFDAGTNGSDFIILAFHQRINFHHLMVQPLVYEITFRIENVCNSARHSCAKVTTSPPEADYSTTCHVFTTVVAKTFDDCIYTRVTDTESFAGHSGNVRFAAGGSIKANIPGNDIFLCDECRVCRGSDDHFGSRKSLATVIVSVARNGKCHTIWTKGGKALPR